MESRSDERRRARVAQQFQKGRVAFAPALGLRAREERPRDACELRGPEESFPGLGPEEARANWRQRLAAASELCTQVREKKLGQRPLTFSVQAEPGG